MLYACASRFDVVENLEKFLVFGVSGRKKFHDTVALSFGCGNCCLIID
jgi:hypothetical protein